MRKEFPTTYVISLRKRIDRRQHIFNQFKKKKQFKIVFVDAIENNNGARGLWDTVLSIIKNAEESKKDIVIVEDDHSFTSEYSPILLSSAFEEAKNLSADVLCGGISWFQDAIPASKNLYWTNSFTGTQFIVIFHKFLDRLLNAKFKKGDTIDKKIGLLTDKTFFIYPFISVQKDFGYSDVTLKNNHERRVEGLFSETMMRLNIINSVNNFYLRNTEHNYEKDNLSERLNIPTYVINLPERVERLNHIKREFSNKPEFDVKYINACKNEVGALGLWLSIRTVIVSAIKNKDDVIIICEDDHKFTSHYTKEYLFKNIIEAHYQGVDLLSGGPSNFFNAIPVSKNRFWVSFFQAAQFVVVYKRFFKKILDLPFDETVIGDLQLSSSSTNKMVLYPCISIQKDFGYSDVTPQHNEDKKLVQTMFKNANNRLKNIYLQRELFLQFEDNLNCTPSLSRSF